MRAPVWSDVSTAAADCLRESDVMARSIMLFTICGGTSSSHNSNVVFVEVAEERADANVKTPAVSESVTRRIWAALEDVSVMRTQRPRCSFVPNPAVATVIWVVVELAAVAVYSIAPAPMSIAPNARPTF